MVKLENIIQLGEAIHSVVIAVLCLLYVYTLLSDCPFRRNN